MENWIENAIVLMHRHKITQIEIAKELSVTNDYISMIFRGVKNPKGAEEKIKTAIDKIISERRAG